MARLNLAHFQVEELPSSPYNAAKLIRHIARSTKKACLSLKKTALYVNHLVLSLSEPLRAETKEDLETAKRQKEHSTDPEQASEETTLDVKDRYRRSLRKVFKYMPLVDGIMWDIDKWEIAE